MAISQGHWWPAWPRPRLRSVCPHPKMVCQELPEESLGDRQAESSRLLVVPMYGHSKIVLSSSIRRYILSTSGIVCLAFHQRIYACNRLILKTHMCTVACLRIMGIRAFLCTRKDHSPDYQGHVTGRRVISSGGCCISLPYYWIVLVILVTSQGGMSFGCRWLVYFLTTPMDLT